MRRTFLLQMLTGGMAIAAHGIAASSPEAPADSDEIVGDWHMLDPEADEVDPPSHRMDLRFKTASGELKGAILSRVDGSEIPLAKSAFDGSILRFQMVAPPDRTQAEMPFMVMTRAGSKFEGQWTSSAGEKTGPKFKLVRARK